MDAVLDTDWAAHWRGLVEARQALRAERAPGGDPWAVRAGDFARQVVIPRDWFMSVLEPWLRPTATLIDVGSGPGRYAAPLARRLDWVTAVEPSEPMRDRMPPADNLTVIGSSWEDAEPVPADLVICVHVLYGVADPVPFLEKLERSARERVFVVMRDSPHTIAGEVLGRLLAGSRPREPWLRDLLLLLRQLGIRPDLRLETYESTYRFASMEVAVEQCRHHVGPAWDEARGRAWLEANLRLDEDGSVRYDGGELTSGVLHWTPRT
jgi:SAM-dependent methyltransferase